MTIALLVMSDGRRDCLTATVLSACEQLAGPITERWMHDDTGDDQHRAWLRDTIPGFTHIDGGPRQGFGGAIRSAWTQLQARSDASHIFATEDDFTFNRPVGLEAMVDVLDRHPDLVHLALRRQSWNEAERAAGGVVEQHPDAYVDRSDGVNEWLEHTLFWTTNVSLFRRSLLGEGWPEGDHSEGRFAFDLLDRHPAWRFGYWGSRYSGEWVHHIGDVRVGIGY